MKTSPSLVNFFIYNSTFGPKEGMVCDIIFKEHAFKRILDPAALEAWQIKTRSFWNLCL